MTLFVCYLAFYAIFNLISPNLTVKYIGHKGYNVLSDSMKPIFEKGDYIKVVKKDFNNLSAGDIVSFIDPNKNVVTHKFVRFESIIVNGDEIKVFRTIGNYLVDKDGNEISPVIDYWKIDEANYIGVYSYKIKGLGTFFSFISSWVGVLTIIFTIVVLYFIYFIIKKYLIKEDNKKTYETSN